MQRHSAIQCAVTSKLTVDSQVRCSRVTLSGATRDGSATRTVE